MTTKVHWKPPFLTFIDNEPNEGSNASNSALTVEVHRNEGECYPAIYAQEVYECRRKWQPWTWFQGALARELMGHAVECQVAREVRNLDEAGLADYELGEAMVIARGYVDIEPMSDEDALALLKAKRNDARAWVEAHRGEVEKWKGWW